MVLRVFKLIVMVFLVVAMILFLIIYLISHLADAFIQSDLQMRPL